MEAGDLMVCRSHSGESDTQGGLSITGDTPAAHAHAHLQTILAVDPGTAQSGWCLIRGDEVIESGVADNVQMLYSLPEADLLAVEVFEARGMPIGEDSIETIIFTGRLMQAWGGAVRIVKRSHVKRHLCGSMKAKDANIRQVLIDRYGGEKAIGRKASPGPLYGVKSHAWAALAVAVTVREMDGEAA